MMEQDWHTECQMLLHPDQAIIDQDKLTLSSPPSTCPKCHSRIRWYQNIPLLSWLFLKGNVVIVKIRLASVIL
jgi:leader peptidase (prepilin peptidase)/N-methyltransferase